MVLGVEHHPAASALGQDGGARVGQRHPLPQRHPQPGGQIRIAHRRRLPAQRQLEGDVEHDQPATGPLEQGVPIPEGAVSWHEGAHGLPVPVPHPHLRDRLGHLLAVGADILDRRGAGRARDAGECLHSRPAFVDRVRDQFVPRFAGGDPHERAGAAVHRFHLYAAGGHPHDRAGEAGVGDDDIRAAGHDEQWFTGVIDLADRVDQFIGARHRDQPSRSAPDPHCRERRQRCLELLDHLSPLATPTVSTISLNHQPPVSATSLCHPIDVTQSSWTTATARPSTLSPPLVAVSSTVAWPTARSSLVTRPVTSTSAPPS